MIWTRTKVVMSSHYDVLGVHPNSSAEEIKSAFLRLSKQTHPDAVGGCTANVQKFQRISEAAR